MIPLFVLPCTLLVVLANSTSGDHHFCEIVTLCRPPSHQDWGRARTAGNRFARDDKEGGLSWGRNNYPENGLVKPLRRDTRVLSPAGMFGGKAPLRLAAQSLLSLQMGSINKTRLESHIGVRFSNSHEFRPSITHEV